MKRLFAVILSIAVLTSSAYAHFVPKKEKSDDEQVTFIVEVEGNPSLVEKSVRENYDLDTVTDEILESQEKVLSLIKDEVSSGAKKGFVYTALFNGFSIDAKRGQLDELKKLDGVKNVFISEKIPVPEPMVSKAEEFTGINSAYDSGFGGEGQVIAIIDDGCDTSHDFFATAPKNPKYTKEDIDYILKNRQLNSNVDSANQVHKNEKIPYAFNYATMTSDTYSKTSYHGTHVTGIAAGKNGTYATGEKFSGVAYDSQIIFMNASRNGYLYTDMIIASLNDAALLEADVINMSFGADYLDSSDSEKAYKQIIDNARKAGISITSSAGNSSRGYDDITPLAENPDYSSSGTPACYSSVTAVASADNKEISTSYWIVKLKDETELDFYPTYSGSGFDEIIKDDYVEYEYCGLGTVNELVGKDLTGKIALIDRGDITFKEKEQNAKSVGAIGIIIANHDNSIISTSSISMPAAAVTKTTGNKLKNAGEKCIKLKNIGFTTNQIKNAGKISSFSSWGVDSSLQLKPEITAPGGSIYSSYPDNKYAYLSGTSMSSPYMAGVYAIARQYYNTNPYAEIYNGLSGENLVDLIENLAMTSADIIRTEDGLAFSPRRQGAGMVNVKNIIGSQVIAVGDLGKSKVSLGEISESFEVPFTLTNISKETAVFDKISVELLTDGYEVTDGKKYVASSVALEAEEITVPEKITLCSGEQYSFTATVKLDKTFLEQNKKIFTNGFFVDGFVILQGESDEVTVSVPFTGFYGDWYNIPIFDKTVYDEGGSTLEDADEPYRSGTYLRMGDEEGFYYVGRNLSDKKIVDKKYISYSPESGLDLELVLKNYRAVSKTLVSIEDKAQNMVYGRIINQILSKFIPVTYKYDTKALKSLPEGEYMLKVEAAANGSDEINDTLELPLVIDKTSPNFLGAAYDKDSKVLTVSASDNHYLQFFGVAYDDEQYNYYTVTDNDLKDGVVTKKIDLSHVNDLNSVEIEVCDYAMNYDLRTFAALTDKIGAELNDIQRTQGYTQASVSVINNSSSVTAADIIVSFYDENSKMIGVDVRKNCSLAAYKPFDVNFKMLTDTREAVQMKIFVFEPNSVMPIDISKSFVLK